MKRFGLVSGAILALLWIAPLRAQAQTGTVRGTVTDADSKQPLAGATVTITGKNAITTSDGKYQISGVEAGTHTVRVRMLGYAPATQSVTIIGGPGAVVADVAMGAQAVSLSEIVVTGYGEQKAGDITGAVTSLSTEDFNPGTIVSPEQLIAAKVAGVQVVDNNEPGGGIAVRIRGATSVTASSDPLYVVDGMPIGTGAGGGLSAGRDPLNFLNPNDIESITVLKDASSAAIYGANAANGVVLITTKSGKGGPRIEYSGSASSSSVTRLPSMLNAAQFRAAVQQYDTVALPQLKSASTDWLGLISRTAFGQEHNVTVSGGGASNSYRLAFGYMNQDGVIRGSNTQRMSLGFNYDQRLLGDFLDIKANIKGSRTYDQFTPGGVLGNAAQMGPTQPVYDSSTATGYYNWPGNTLTSADNPIEILNLGQANGTTYRSVGNLQGDYRMPFFPALRANLNLGYDVTQVSSEYFNPSTLHSELKQGFGGELSHSNPSQINTVLEAYLNYNAPLNVIPGNIDVTGGYSYAQSHSESPSVYERGLATDLLGTSGTPSASTIQNFMDIQDSKLISFFGRVNYNLADRYLIAASIRRDGSSRFATTNAWGNFPSVSVAWRLSQEPFMSSFRALSDLKLRASWAKTGNQAFANYQQYTTFLTGNAQAQAQFGNTFVSTIRPSAVDPNIKWEATSSYNVGLDFGFANQRFSGAIDWYTKKTTDLLFFVPIAAGTNLSNFLTTNIGSMQNRGLELSLSARLIEPSRDGLGWTADFSASTNSNKLLTITPFGGTSQQILTGGIAGGVGSTIQVLEPNQPINSFFVCRQAYDAQGKPKEGSYYNLAGDSVVTRCTDNKRAYKNPAPTWILGHTSYFTFRNFDLSFTLRAWLGNYVYNNIASNTGNYRQLYAGNSPYNLSTDVLKTGFVQPQYLSDYYVQDGSFLRMDNISLGYSFKYRGQQMRLFGTVQNVFTITGYKGVDPTAGLNGIDNNIYPRSRIVTGGLSVQL